LHGKRGARGWAGGRATCQFSTNRRVQENSILKRRQRDGTLFGCVFSLYIRQVNPLKKFPRALAQQKTL
jgi:hypothetical protein